MNNKKILSYVSALEANNNREWFHANKPEYQEAKALFEDLIAELMLRLGVTDPGILHHNPKDLTFKLMRDTRFSHDKSPYNPAFRAHISAAGKMPVPVGYYLLIRPGNRSFIGGGLFAAMFRDATEMLRHYIVENGTEFAQIISKDAFTENFTVKGEALKNVPAGYDKSHPQAQYLKNKSWYLEYPIADDLFLNTDCFIKIATEKFILMQPFNAFLNRALVDFKMPHR